ncbi:MAG: hypothetical protein JXR96_10475 [Deltaproteobacteria bacterium]|nr:hypothetical protein [Deltaproteobacteria bacterium]
MTRASIGRLSLALLSCVACLGCGDSGSPFANPECKDRDDGMTCLIMNFSIDAYSSVAADAPGDLVGDLHWELEPLTSGQAETGILPGVDLSAAEAKLTHTIANAVPGTYRVYVYLDDDDSGDLSAGDPHYDSMISGHLPPDDERRLIVLSADHEVSRGFQIDLIF